MRPREFPRKMKNARENGSYVFMGVFFNPKACPDNGLPGFKFFSVRSNTRGGKQHLLLLMQSYRNGTRTIRAPSALDVYQSFAGMLRVGMCFRGIKWCEYGICCLLWCLPPGRPDRKRRSLFSRCSNFTPRKAMETAVFDLQTTWLLPLRFNKSI